MNYKIIIDEIKFKEFIEFLPELDKNECYYISLLCRGKYIKHDMENKVLHNMDYKLKNEVCNSKKEIFYRVKQMECEVGSFYDFKNEIAIPQNMLALYITINPRDKEKAIVEHHKGLTEYIYERKPCNILSNASSAIQKTPSKRKFMHYDIDVDKTVITLDNLIRDITKACDLSSEFFNIVETRGGYHLLVSLENIKKFKINRNWVTPLKEYIKTISSDKVSDEEKLLPIVGCSQGGFMPILHTF